MIRPLDWRDLALLRRVGDQGFCFDSQLAYTRGPNPFQTILIDLVRPGRMACTLVSRPEDQEQQAAIGQIHHRPGDTHAKLSFIGPETAFENSASTHLLDSLAKAAGERGAHHLIAEIDEQDIAFEALRKAGYAIYARQRIWRLEAASRAQRSDGRMIWRSIDESDEPAINHLYHNIVPALVQQVEHPPHQDKGDYVHYVEGELHGYLDIESGPRGVWAHPYFHPAAEAFDSLFANFIESYSDHRKRPLYLSVRSYQGWMTHGLEKLGFTACSDQAVMVKRLTAMLRHPAHASLPAVEGRRPEPTTPMVRYPHSE